MNAGDRVSVLPAPWDYVGHRGGRPSIGIVLDSWRWLVLVQLVDGTAQWFHERRLTART